MDVISHLAHFSGVYIFTVSLLLNCPWKWQHKAVARSVVWHAQKTMCLKHLHIGYATIEHIFMSQNSRTRSTPCVLTEAQLKGSWTHFTEGAACISNSVFWSERVFTRAFSGFLKQKGPPGRGRHPSPLGPEPSLQMPLSSFLHFSFHLQPLINLWKRSHR